MGCGARDIIVPEPIQHVLWKQIAKGDFLDAVFELKDIHKEVLYYSAIRQYFNQRIAHIRSQTDRTILKVKNTILKKLRKKVYFALCEKTGNESVTKPKGKRVFKGMCPYFSDRNK